MTPPPAIVLNQVVKEYRLFASPFAQLKDALFPSIGGGEKVRALKGVSLTVERGETVGIVGRNGSGKSTLLQIVCGTLPATSGSAEVQGRISALLELGAGFNPDFTGRENIFLNGMILGLSEAEIQARYDAIVAFSGLPPALIEQPVKTYSSGMVVRLAFAVAISADPDILVVDEAMSVGDEAFQRKCFARIREIQDKGATILFVSHSSTSVIELCDRAVLLEGGELVMDGAPKAVITAYHKLIYAPADKQKQILADIRADLAADERLAQRQDMKADYDPYLRPESLVEYSSHGAFIENPRIATLDGAQVNQLIRGEEYLFSYDVRIDAEAEKVNFGMLIKTRSGIELGGGSTAITEAFTQPRVVPGEHYRLTFRFRASLAPDVYFLNAGCSGVIHGHSTFLHRITDVLMFRVLPGEANHQTGMVDFGITPNLEKRI